MMKRYTIGLLLCSLIVVFLLVTLRETIQPENELKPNAMEILYQGQASIRIMTEEGFVIYIDPYSGSEYEEEADLILVTHDHFDHSDINKVKNRNPDCRIITHEDSLKEGIHQTIDLSYVIIEAVEAGNNKYHDINNCVGYILTFNNGIKVYMTGDTAITNQMSMLSSQNIDYAFICCDGVYTMSMEDAIEAAQMINAKNSIPYHMVVNGDPFDRRVAETFSVDNRLILEAGESIIISKE